MPYNKTTWKNGDVVTASNLNKIEDELGSLIGFNYIFANDYGAAADGVTDDTANLQKALNAVTDHNILKFQGTYLISASGKDDGGLDYALILNNKNNVVLDFSSATFLLHTKSGTETIPNFFEVIGCSNVKIINGIFQASYDVNIASPIYTGGLYVYGCSHVVLEHQEFNNTKYGVLSFESEDVSVSHLLYYHYLQSYDAKYRPWSAIIFYDTVRGIASHNTVYGGLQDGDISVFGGKTQDCLIAENHMYTSVYGDVNKEIKVMQQGITIDQGPLNTQVLNNYIYGYYFGIDSKANSFNTQIKGNFLQSCKVGIADRRGEASNGDQTYNIIIHDNTVNFGVMPDDSDFNPWGYKAVGIWIQHRFGADVANNTIEVDKFNDTSTLLVAGMYLEGIDPTTLGNTDYLTPFRISGNLFKFRGGHDGSYTIVGDGSVAIISNTIYHLSIVNNVANMPINNHFMRLMGSHKEIFVSGNSVSPTSVGMLVKDDGFSVNNYINTDNHTYDDKWALDMDNEYIQIGNHNREFMIKRAINKDTYTELFSITQGFAGSKALIGVKAINSATDSFIDKVYTTKTDTLDTLLLSEQGGFGNILLQAVTTKAGVFSIQAKSPNATESVTFKVTILTDSTDIKISDLG